MTMNRDLFLAILSMDSYNRGYGEGITGLKAPELNPDGTPKTVIRIGNATISGDSLAILGPDAQAAGFYALAYDMTGASGFAAGERVISYRGTNFNINWDVSTFFSSPILADVVSGWSVGAGLAGKQAALAIDFYNAVAPDGMDPRLANITTTGHSLGGGFAGFIANVFSQKAVLFDHMPYSPISESLRSYLNVKERFFGGANIPAFSSTRISAFSTKDEVLSYARSGVSAETSTPVPSYVDLGSVELHSMALLVSLMWARDNVMGTDWQAAAPYVWNGYFDTAVANALPAIDTLVGPLGNALSAMQSAIAYSAISEGTRVFGDTGIRALFDDADDMGALLKLPAFALPDGFQDDEAQKALLGKLIAEYAGLLAVRRVEAADNADAIKGVLTLTPAANEDTPGVFHIDMSAATWTPGKNDTEHQFSLKSDLVAGFLNSAEASNLIAVLSDWYASYAQDTRTGNLVRDIDEILLQLTTQNKGGIARARDDAGVSLNIGSDNDNSIFPLSKRCA